MADQVIARLIGVLGLELDSKAKKHLAEFDEALDGVKKTFEAIAIVGAGGAAAVMWEWIKSSTEAGDQADEMSKRLGVSAEKYQELAYAAHFMDVETSTLGKGFKKLQIAVGNASQGNAQAQGAFRALGVELKTQGGVFKSTDQIMEEVLNKLAATPNETERNAQAFDLFGQATFGMQELLEKGGAGLAKFAAEARSMGVVLDKEAVEQASGLKDEFDRLGYAAQGLRNEVGIALTPEIRKTVKAFRDWILAHRDIQRARLEGSLRVLSTLVKVVGGGVIGLVDALWRVADAMGGAENAAKLLFIAWASWKSLITYTALTDLLTASIGKSGAIATLWGNQVFWASLRAQAGFLIAVAEVAILVLVFEDLYRAFTGGKSVFVDLGKLLEKSDFGRVWREYTAMAEEAFGPGIMAFIVGGLAALGDYLYKAFLGLEDEILAAMEARFGVWVTRMLSVMSPLLLARAAYLDLMGQDPETGLQRGADIAPHPVAAVQTLRRRLIVRPGETREDAIARREAGDNLLDLQRQLTAAGRVVNSGLSNAAAKTALTTANGSVRNVDASRHHNPINISQTINMGGTGGMTKPEDVGDAAHKGAKDVFLQIEEIHNNYDYASDPRDAA